MINKETIEQIKNAVDIVEVIDDFVQLKKAGSSYKGLSPFAEEKTPSFVVSPAKGIFKDFSTGKGGDAISFIMEHEGLSYVEALKYLAQKYGIEVQEKEQTPEQVAAQTERESLFIALEFAKEYYKEILFEHKSGISVGQSYFKERGLIEETIATFDLGFSLEDWDGLVKAAEKRQFNIEILEKAGLVIRKEQRVYDRFRDRAIFPIHNLSGKVIGFGARILKVDKKQPKYINSPETDVYHKSNVLYGLFQAKNFIRNDDNCYLVEGYTDVLALHQGGIKNVVASSGTALTSEQIKLIGRYTKNVTVLYDGDAAGIRASTRGIDLILEAGLNVNAVVFPEGEDPDSFIKKIGASEFLEFLKKEKSDFISFKTKLFLEEAGDDPIKRADVIREIIESIAKITDPIKRTVFFQKCSNLLGIDESVLISEYNKIHLKNRKKSKEDEERRQEALAEEAQYLGIPVEDKPKANTVEQTLMDQEREVIRLLVNYGDKEVDEDTKLAEYMVPELDDVEFLTPGFEGIAIKYREMLEAKNLQNYSVFLDEGNSLKSVVIDLISTPYEISENWKRHQIFVAEETDDLAKVAYTSILRLKWRKIRVMTKEAHDKMQKATEEEIEEIQRDILRFKEMEMSIAKLLGNVAMG